MNSDKEILDRIIYLLKESKKSQKELCNFLNVTDTTFCNWKTLRNKSFMKYLYQIADYFDVSVEYLKGETNEKKPPQEGASDNIITEERLKALGIDTSQLYDLTDNELEIIRTTLHALVENFKKNK